MAPNRRTKALISTTRRCLRQRCPGLSPLLSTLVNIPPHASLIACTFDVFSECSTKRRLAPACCCDGCIANIFIAALAYIITANIVPKGFYSMSAMPYRGYDMDIVCMTFKHGSQYKATLKGTFSALGEREYTKKMVHLMLHDKA